MVPKYLRHGYMYPCNVCDGLFSYHSHGSVCLLFSMSLGILLPILLVQGLNGIHHMHIVHAVFLVVIPGNLGLYSANGLVSFL